MTQQCGGREDPRSIDKGTFRPPRVTQPAPAPRFGRTACGPPSPPARPGADTNDVLAGVGFSAAEIASLRDNGAAI